MEAGVTPGENGLVLVDLIGEDGRFIARQRLDFREFTGRSIGIAPRLEFKLPGVAETARLVISVEDRFNRLIALASTEVVLFSFGENQNYPAGNQAQPYIIRQPVPDQVIDGGTLKVIALARPVNPNPLILELIDEQRQVIASVQTNILLPGGDQSHSPFEIDIPYKVTTATRVRLTLYQKSNNRIPGIIALWSVPILLQP